MRPFGSVVLPKKVQNKLWPINRSNLLIQDGRHQYVAIHNISLTCNYNIVNNSSIPSFFGMATALMLLVLCFKVKFMHSVKVLSSSPK